MQEDWRSAVIVGLYKGKGERTEYKNYGEIISILSVGGKIYDEILVVFRVIWGFIDDERGGLLDQIFTLKQIGEQAREKCMWV